ncbi:heme-degrading domain-containing protein [Rhodoferax sp. GW822-FHT02A01]|uniref:heme-degrading domain-containing protein n=1 Tax=Rhodoferax sp. GW822-FHT02A01 TaxID=3141537 RepID=UPI00315CC222
MSKLDQDMQRLALQEQLLQLSQFDETVAWDLGCRIKLICEARQVGVTIEVRRAKETLFFYAMPGVVPNNSEWVRRKRNVVELLHRSSYAVGLAHQKDNTSLPQKTGVSLNDYAEHGGSFPIRVKGVGCVGAVTVSGVPQREDHAIVVEALAELCGIPLAEVALEP